MIWQDTIFDAVNFVITLPHINGKRNRINDDSDNGISMHLEPP
jgi:hypothetical protein